MHDAGMSGNDGGTMGSSTPKGCGCSTGGLAPWVFALLALTLKSQRLGKYRSTRARRDVISSR
jgi:hypothetical protein